MTRVLVVLLALGLLAPASAGADTVKVPVRPAGTKLKVPVPANADVSFRIGGLCGRITRSDSSSWACGTVYVEVSRRSRRWVKVKAFGGPRRLNLRLTVTAPTRTPVATPPQPTPEPTCLTEYEAQLKTTEVVQGLAPLIPDPADPTGTKLVPASGGFSGGRGSDTCTDAVYPTGGTECTRQSPMRVTCLGQWNVPENVTPPYGVLTLRFAQVAVTKGPDGSLSSTTETVGNV